MIIIPEINPVALSIGPLSIRWYGLMYLVGFAAAFILGWRRAFRKWSPIKSDQFQDVIFYALVGLIAGARIGYTLFYNGDNFFNHPLEIFAVWNGACLSTVGLLVFSAQCSCSHGAGVCTSWTWEIFSCRSLRRVCLRGVSATS